MCLRGAAKLARMSRGHASGIVIVGGGLAGQRCAEALRRSGWERPIRMICADELADVAIVIGDGPDRLLMRAAEGCPSTAIRLIDADSDEQVYP